MPSPTSMSIMYTIILLELELSSSVVDRYVGHNFFTCVDWSLFSFKNTNEMLCMCQEFPNKKNPSVTNMENITGSMATSVIIAHSSLLIILTIVIVFVYLYLNFETNRDGKQCKCGKASVIGAQGQQLSVLPPVPGQPSPSPIKFVHSFCICLWRQKYFWSIALCISLVTRLPPPLLLCTLSLFLQVALV